ncbi:MAG TPA: DUF1338 domain-containing protein [Planctomicrobium sp.]|nr:DUF1338 domain-containing protein [Planctomicrobium sp.]
MASSVDTDKLTLLLDRLWGDFSRINPQAGAIHLLLERRGETVVNDHIAFRTFADPRVGIDVIAKPFVAAGYTRQQSYQFKQKKLDACHYEHPDPTLPKVFISELKLQECSQTVQHLVENLLSQIPAETLNDPEFCLSGRPWEVSYADTNLLAQESEYAGWMAAFGYRANHFTVLVNSLKTVGSLEELNTLLKESGFPLNGDGGEIKGGPDELLEQSSTLAPPVTVPFTDGDAQVPGCYYEFAKRYPRADGTLFSGFVTTSADKIFQSTDRRDAR